MNEKEARLTLGSSSDAECISGAISVLEESSYDTCRNALISVFFPHPGSKITTEEIVSILTNDLRYMEENLGDHMHNAEGTYYAYAGVMKDLCSFFLKEGMIEQDIHDEILQDYSDFVTD